MSNDQDGRMSTSEVEVATVSLPCEHPALVTRTEPKPWAPRGEIKYLPCAVCRTVILERKLALVALHATGRCHCKKADDCHAIIRAAVEDEKIGDAEIRRDAIQECLDAIMQTRSRWSVRSELKYVPIVDAVDEVCASVEKLKDVE